MDWQVGLGEALNLLRRAKYRVFGTNGTMQLGMYAPGNDDQTPPHHLQDELYIIARGHARFAVGDTMRTVSAGDALFVTAGTNHRFDGVSSDFKTWVIFYGPEGGESPETARAGTINEVPRA